MHTNMQSDEWIADLYRRGYSTDEIADMRGIRQSKAGIRRILAAQKVTLRPRGTVSKRVLTTSQYASITAQYPNPEARDAALLAAVTAPFGKRGFIVPRKAKPEPASVIAAPARAPARPTTGKASARYGSLAKHAADVIAEYARGDSGHTIAEKYGVNARSVYNFLERHNIPRRDRGNKTVAGMEKARTKMLESWDARRRTHAASATPNLTMEARNKALVKARVEEGLTYGDLCKRFKVSRQRVSQILQREGITSRPGRPSDATIIADYERRRETGLVPEPQPQWTALVNLSQQMGVIQSAVVAIANMHGILVNPDGTVERVEVEASKPPFVEVDFDALPISERYDIPSRENGAGRWAVKWTADDHGTYYTGHTDRLPAGWRYMTELERLHAWAARGGTPPSNMVVRDDEPVELPVEAIYG